jgi:hypothetical protein
VFPATNRFTRSVEKRKLFYCPEQTFTAVPDATDFILHQSNHFIKTGRDPNTAADFP